MPWLSLRQWRRRLVVSLLLLLALTWLSLLWRPSHRPQAPIIPPAPADPAAGNAFALNAVAAAAAAQIPARGGNAAIDVASLAKSLDWSHAYKVRKFNQFLNADPEFLEKWAASSRALNAAVEKNFETTPSARARFPEIGAENFPTLF